MKLMIYLICVIALASTAWMFSRSGLGSDLPGIRMVAVALALFAAVAAWRLIVRRRQKEKLEQMRDSALW